MTQENQAGWAGQERRTNTVTHRDLSDIWELLHKIDKKLDEHLIFEEQRAPKLDELVTLMERSKGAVTFIRITAYVIAPLLALIYWAREHVKL